MSTSEMTSAELEKIHAEIGKIMAESAKLNAETNKIHRETFWMPVAIATGLVGAVAGITAVLIKLIG